ncbi:MAG: glycosyltransferase [Kiritimatiellae bacterium]|nr:glycosyltransferase [Kiritimatiellia bacterium]
MALGLENGQVRRVRAAKVRRPGVSIVMPVRNADRYVRAAVESILAQTGITFEVIAVDDDSRDASAEELLSIRDDRLTVLSLSRKMGISRTRNIGSQHARAAWLCVFDADDLMLPETLAPYFAAVTAREDAFWGYCGLTLVDAGGAPLGARMRNPFDLLKLLQKNIIPHPMALVRRDVFVEAGGYDEDLPVGADYDLWLRLLEQGDPVFFDETCVQYRQHKGNISKTADTSARVRSLLDHRVLYPHPDPHQERRRVLLRHALLLLDAAAGRRWREVIVHGSVLMDGGVLGFELDRHISEALRALGHRREALNVALMWVEKLSRGQRLLPYESVWTLCQALSVAAELQDSRVISALLPLAERMIPALKDPNVGMATEVARDLLRRMSEPMLVN